MQFLDNVGCNDVQGYLFGKPMPAPEIHELLKEFKGAAQFNAQDTATNDPICGKDAAA